MNIDNGVKHRHNTENQVYSVINMHERDYILLSALPCIHPIRNKLHFTLSFLFNGADNKKGTSDQWKSSPTHAVMVVPHHSFSSHLGCVKGKISKKLLVS